jgi:hypothetical protein
MIRCGNSALKLSAKREIEVFLRGLVLIDFGRDRESGQKQRSPDLAERSYKIRGFEDGALLNGLRSYGSTVTS